MQVTFRIKCHTVVGQMLYFLIDEEPPLQMIYDSDFVWAVDFMCEKSVLNYHFKVADESGKTIFEELQGHTVAVSDTLASLLITDELELSNLYSVFQTTPFTKCMYAHTVEPFVQIENGQYVFEVLAPTILPSQTIAVTGNLPQLGEWQQAFPLRYAGNGLWRYVIAKQKIQECAEYKFVICDFFSKSILKWEHGDNRRICFDENCKYISSQIVRCRFRDNFLFRGAGVAIPVFSLSSKESCGVGDFYDLKLMVDWAAATGQQLIQILPINDTTNTKTNGDSYPYSANSVYALHLMYVRLEALGLLKDKSFLKTYQQQKDSLNNSKFVDYQSVVKIKEAYLKQLYRQERQTVFAKRSYQQFFTKNKNWLVPYAVFSVLREQNKTSIFHLWKHLSVFVPEQVGQFAEQNAKEVGFYYFVQYYLSQQLQEVREYAHSKGVVLKGDLPIGISRYSVDAWMYPNLFHLDKQAGAPPDDFSVKGQNWGFPTYNWEEMAQNGFSWWKSRFANMANYFDAYRIDHILGFFRIWEIPTHAVWGLLGTFNPAMPLSREEIERYGVHFDEETFLTPYITDSVLEEVCGADKDWIFDFLDIRQCGVYQFKNEFDTQQKIHKFFSENGFLEKQPQHYEILMMLQTEVLFIRDTTNKELFHPRINLHTTKLFVSLDHNMQAALARLHEDFFYHRHTEFWKQQALNKLPYMLKASKMLVCGEDLGMVPTSVPEVMAQLQILSLEIQRMPKEFGVEFIDPHSTPYLSVCTTGSHDMATLRGWWKENSERTQRYYNTMLHCEGEAPEECTAEMAEKILSQQLESNSMWTILPLQDYLAVSDELKSEDIDSERINNPANPHHFWCYRMHITLEKLLEAVTFNEKIRNLIVEYRK